MLSVTDVQRLMTDGKGQKMRKYINKESVLDIVTDCDISRDEVVDCIEAIPSFDVAPVRHGRWIQRKIRESQFFQNGYTRLCCSVCNEYSEGEYHYCPNCGARMDGKDLDRWKDEQKAKGEY